MQVIDTFIFDNEFDLLDLRFKVLGKHVDWFVLCENKYTFQGKEKPYHSLQIELPGNCRVVRSELKFDNPWDVENGQRDEIMSAVYDIVKPGDWILHGDVDEIPLLDNVDFSLMPAMFVFQQPCYYFYWNLYGKQWLGTQAMRYPFSLPLSTFRSPEVRGNMGYRFPAGWHFSWSGGAEAARHKIRSFSHTELNRPEVLDNIEKFIAEGKVMWHDPDIKQLKKVTMNMLPKYVQEHESEYRQKGLLL